MTDSQKELDNGGNHTTNEETEMHLDALHTQRPAHDKNDFHASLDLVSHTQRTGVRGDGLVSRGRIAGFEDSFDDSMMLGESFAVDDRDEPRRANPNTYKQLESIQDMTEEDEEEEDDSGSERDAKPDHDDQQPSKDNDIPSENASRVAGSD